MFYGQKRHLKNHKSVLTVPVLATALLAKIQISFRELLSTLLSLKLSLSLTCSEKYSFTSLSFSSFLKDVLDLRLRCYHWDCYPRRFFGSVGQQCGKIMEANKFGGLIGR